MTRPLAAVALAILAFAFPARAERFTDSCRAGFETHVTIEVTPAAAASIADTATGRQPALFRRLWGPLRMVTYSSSGRSFVELHYSSTQDFVQIASELASDARLRSLGLKQAMASGGEGVCYSPSPVAAVWLTEFHNAKLDRYFLSSSEDPPGAWQPSAPDWKPTGETYEGPMADQCHPTGKTTFNFFNTQKQIQVITDDPRECGDLQGATRPWTYRGESFASIRMFPTAEGSCGPYFAPVWRLHDRREPLSERLVWRSELRAAMVARGWIDEGVAFCVN
jgi:hypothetical protein